MQRLKQLAEEYGVAERIKFLGYVPDEKLLELYANAFAVFFAPVDEDYGYITLEAFLSHKPVITATDSGGVLEFVEDDANGYICEPKSEAIGNRINELYHSRRKCKEFGEMGYMAVKDISWDHVIDLLTESIR